MPRASSDAQLQSGVADARARSIELVADLSEEQLRVPYLATVNPLVWELCHLAHFYEQWVLCEGAGQALVRPDARELFDSTTIAHEARWRLPVPGREEAFAYVGEVRDRVLALCEAGLADERLRYLVQYATLHEDMHTEALTCTRQTLGLPAPRLEVERAPAPPRDGPGGSASGDVQLAGGRFALGAARDVAFCFDNEKWAHPVELAPFAIARCAVSEGEFAAFVEDGGYERRALWSPEGWAWRQAESAAMPLYWRRSGRDGYERRHFDQWTPLEEGRALCHVCWYEAEAYCRWAGRRLPSEAEWEAAAALEADGTTKRSQPWGEEPSDAARANLDWRHMGPTDVAALPAGDSAAGCRQMMGNVWEWTACTFRPYPGFVPDMYEDYSQTSLHTRKVLRGGAWATRSRLICNTWRNFFQPSRRDIFAGFRTCAPA